MVEPHAFLHEVSAYIYIYIYILIDYPTFIAVLSNDTRYLVAQNFSRVVTNIGNDIAVYQSHVENVPNGMRIGVLPETLTFTHKNQKQGFVVSIEIDRAFSMVIYGFLKWVDEHNHIVSSPIVTINF